MLFTIRFSFCAFLITLFLCVLQTTALPSFWPRRSFPQLKLRKRTLAGAVYICTDFNFRGDCAWQAPSSDCRIPGTGDEAPLSIGPDPGGFCVLYEKSTCEGREIITLKFPGMDWAIPSFGGMKCFVGDGAGQNFTAEAPIELVNGDPRLDGGAGSIKNRQLKDVLEAMEKDGFSEGLIGLEKKTYY
ncbi:hypothetical protein K491DRAFT_596394 [Lophiostoma macrostomum CBS 122681]|uniref:Uncharacterized protein n=1 Tax=Lophiostoma macrostomum CBS 122681 TaxID=1314788 RepID=A0A6A6T9T8_9PLEO|nr:hypothetical protein K491DRAFT_596394 [Lophiostoma macrostomum CBS 122681]